MNNVVLELKKVKYFYIATIDNDKPRVRPFSSICEFEGNAYICSGKQKEIYKLIREKTKNKICVYVTHKISNICKDADTIIILKNGKIEDIGRHDELINKSNYYYQLYLKYTSEKEKK